MNTPPGRFTVEGIAGIAPSFLNVMFTAMPGGTYFVAGRPAAHGQEEQWFAENRAKLAGN
jgi:hypothetical protein